MKSFSLVELGAEVAAGVIFDDQTIVLNWKSGNVEMYPSMEEYHQVHLHREMLFDTEPLLLPEIEDLKDSQDECVSNKIKILMKEGKYSQKQAIAIAYSYCKRRKGMKDQIKDTQFLGIAPVLTFTDLTTLEASTTKGPNGLIIRPVILTREIIQIYHRTEVPEWIQDNLPKDITWVTVVKPASELKDAIAHVEKIPIVINHTPEDFLEDSDPRIIGWVKKLRYDDEKRAIKGLAYINEGRIEADLRDRILNGEIVSVSIGGRAAFGPGGKLGDQSFMFSQRNLVLGHLAILPKLEGRCPAGSCGLNMDSVKHNLSHTSAELKLDTPLPVHDHLFGGITTFDQGIFVVADYASISGTQIPPNNSLKSSVPSTSGADSLMGNEDLLKQLQDQLAAKDRDLKEMKDSVATSKLADLQAALSKRDEELKTLKDANASIQDEKKKLTSDLANAQEKIKKLEDAEWDRLADALEATKIPKYSKKDFKDANIGIDILRVKYNTLLEANMIKNPLADAIIKGGFPKPGEEQRGSTGEKPEKLKDHATPDMNTLFNKKE